MKDPTITTHMSLKQVLRKSKKKTLNSKPVMSQSYVASAEEIRLNDMYEDVPLHDLKKGGMPSLFKSISKSMKHSIGEQMTR